MNILATVILFLSGILVLGTQNLRLFSNFIIIYLLIALAFIDLILVISLIIKISLNKKYNAKRKLLLLVPVLILLILIGTKYIVTQTEEAKYSYNQIEIDTRIPKDDVNAVKKIAKSLESHKGLKIRYYDECQPNLATPTPLPNGEINISNGPATSYKCLSGDIFMSISRGSYFSPIAGGEDAYYYLLRKVNGEWVIIEKLGSSHWQS